jgi:hypothetical protein
MKNAQLNTKKEFIANIANVGNSLSINEFVDAGFNLLNTNEITKEEFQSVLHQLLLHFRDINKGV